MQVLFEARHPEALALRALVVRRTRFVMRRLLWLVPRARVRLDDVNGPRGGVDKRCSVELRAQSGEPIVVRSQASDWRQAFDAAIARAVRALLRWRQRRRALPSRGRAVPAAE